MSGLVLVYNDAIAKSVDTPDKHPKLTPGAPRTQIGDDKGRPYTRIVSPSQN